MNPPEESIAPASRGLVLLHALLAVVCLLVCAPRPCAAGGSEYSLRGHDLVLAVDSRWAGGARGGYWPVRISVLNRGPARDCTFRFRPVAESIPSVQKSLRLEQNASARFSLPVPLVGMGTAGELQVLSAGGSVLSGMSQHLVLADFATEMVLGPATLVVGETRVETALLEQGIRGLLTGESAGAAGGGGPYGSYYGSGYPGYAPDADVQLVPARSLPTAWVDYTSLDLVVISLTDLSTLDEGRRNALAAWLETGGNLLVWGTDKLPDGEASLNRLLSLDRRTAIAPSWQKATMQQRKPVEVEASESPFDAELPEVPPELAGLAPDELRKAMEALARLNGQFRNGETSQWNWPAEPNTFQTREVMSGLLLTFPGDPFEGTPHDWAWLLRTIGPDRWEWGKRQGFDARAASTGFLEFLIPDVRSVPIYAFMLLMTMFAIVIGPVNYLILWKKKQLHLLIGTIPVFAFVTSLALFGWSTVSHGFGVKARSRSLTILDQATRTQVTTSRLALFAGVSPSDGLRFSPETAVYPIWPTIGAFQQGSVDWTSTQHLPNGWLKSRTRTQLLTVRHREQRGRLNIGSATGDSLTVANGLEWPLRKLIVRLHDGRLFQGGSLAAGDSLALTATDEAAFRDLRDELMEYPLAVPEHLRQSGLHSTLQYSTGPFGRHYGWQQQESASALQFSSSLMERRLAPLSAASPRADALEPGSWIAVLDAPPDLEYGVEEVEESASLHVAIGYFATP